jgi:hypothetical protein
LQHWNFADLFLDLRRCRLPASEDGRGFLQAEPQPQGLPPSAVPCDPSCSTGVSSTLISRFFFFFFIGTGQAAAIGFRHAAVRRKGRQRHQPQVTNQIQVFFAPRSPRSNPFLNPPRLALLRDGSSNLKWRGGGAVAASTPPKPKAAPKKRFQEDSENHDPALATPPPRQAPSRPPFGAPRWNKNAKEAIKSSAEKRPDNAEKEALLNKHVPPRQLKSTLSARNLFSGKDILGQISEFYDELKRMVGGGVGRPVTDTQEEHSSDPV